MAVLLVAVRSSLMPALLCAVASFLAYDFLFIPPHFPSPSIATKTC